jgi:hypothetical protein
MTVNGIILSTEAFKALSPSCRQEIMSALGFLSDIVAARLDTDKGTGNGTFATEFSLNEMRKFLGGVSDRTRILLTGIARTTSRFNVGELLKSVGWVERDLRGILAGITKRSRTISGNREAEFFSSVVWDDDINKCVSEVHPTTHAALKSLLLAQ